MATGWVALLVGLAMTGPGASGQTVIFGWDQVWSYHDLGMDLGTAWREVDYDASSWPSGPGVLVGRSDATLNEALPVEAQQQGAVNRTGITLRPDGVTTAQTHYFRAAFDLEGPVDGLEVTAWALIDDGAVIYLNGVEIGRVGMGDVDVAFSTPANRALEVATHGLDVLTFWPTNLMATGNVVAVEVHQGGGPNSSDVVMGLTLRIRVPHPPVIAVPPESRTVGRDQPLKLSVVATGDPPLTYRWQKADASGAFTDRTGAVSSEYIQWSAQLTSAGDYRVVVSNASGSITSQVATVRVIEDVIPPTVLWASFQPVPQPGSYPYELEVVFSEVVNMTTGRDPSNYGIYEVGSQQALVVSNNIGFPSYRHRLAVEAWNPAAEYVLTVRNVTDQRGNVVPMGTQVPIGMPAMTELVPLDAAWRYYEAGRVFESSGWRTNHFETVSGHDTGQSVFHLGLSSPVDLCAGVPGSQLGSYPLTAYFSTEFLLPEGIQWGDLGCKLELRTVATDGVILYLNGTEIARINMPAGEVDYETISSTPLLICWTNTIDARLVQAGVNHLAAEVHAASYRAEPFRLFGAQLVAICWEAPTWTPRLSVRPANGWTAVFWSGSGFILEAASNLGGPWLGVSAAENWHYELPAAAQWFWRLRSDAAVAPIKLE